MSRVEAGNVFYIIYCSLKSQGIYTVHDAQLIRSRHICTSSARFASVTSVLFSCWIRKKGAGKGAREKQRECLRALCI